MKNSSYLDQPKYLNKHSNWS